MRTAGGGRLIADSTPKGGPTLIHPYVWFDECRKLGIEVQYFWQKHVLLADHLLPLIGLRHVFVTAKVVQPHPQPFQVCVHITAKKEGRAIYSSQIVKIRLIGTSSWCGDLVDYASYIAVNFHPTIKEVQYCP